MPFDPISKPPSNRVLALALLGLAPLGCEEPASPTPLEPTSDVTVEAPEVEAPVEPAADEPSEQTEALRAWLRSQIATPDQIFRDGPLVYTWTTAEQVEHLRQRPRLLTRTADRQGRQGAFMAHLAGDSHPIARRIRRHGRAQRYGWTNPWGARLGWPEADYGDRLVRVELRADSWIAAFDPSAEEADERWRVTTIDGLEVSSSELAAHPDRVAVVYHAARGVGPAGEERSGREIVLVSERWIKRWTVGGDQLAERLQTDRTWLRALADQLTPPGPDPAAWAQRLLSHWSAAIAADADLVELYDGGLALGSPGYHPDPEHLRALASSLEAPTEPSLSHDVPRRVARPRPSPPASPPPPGYPYGHQPII